MKSNILWVDFTQLNKGKFSIKLFQCNFVHLHQSKYDQYLSSQRICALHLISVAVGCGILVKQICGSAVDYLISGCGEVGADVQLAESVGTR